MVKNRKSSVDKTKADVYKEFAQYIQRAIRNDHLVFLRFVERNELFGLEYLFSERTYGGGLMYDRQNGNQFFIKQLNEWTNLYKTTGKNVTLKEIYKFL